jgi:hypothetical protein
VTSSPPSAPTSPDPQRVDRWRHLLAEALTEVQALVHARANYERFAALVRANCHVLHGESDFPCHVQRWFVHYAAMAVRRIVESDSAGDIISLKGVLDDMHRAARAFTSQDIADLFDAPDSPDYDAELRRFLIASMWSAVGTATPAGQEQLDAKMLKDDRKMLDVVSRDITDLVDKQIAHHTTQARSYDLFYSELSACIDVIEAIALRYNTALLGPSQTTFVPVDQFNWFDIFRRDWLYE